MHLAQYRYKLELVSLCVCMAAFSVLKVQETVHTKWVFAFQSVAFRLFFYVNVLDGRVLISHFAFFTASRT